MRSLLRTYSYSVFGLGISSEIVLPELPLSGLTPDVFIRVLPEDFVDPEIKQSPVHKAYCHHEATVSFEGVGSFRIRRGTYIDLWKDPHVDDRFFRMFIHGVVTGILLHQRGLLVLHGSCMHIHNRAVGLLGFSGAGKSTLAAGLHKIGFDILAEDLVAINFTDEKPIVYPGLPQLRMASDVASYLGYDKEVIESLYPFSEEIIYRYNRKLISEYLSLACIFIIKDSDRINVYQLPFGESFKELVRHTYTANILELTQSQIPHFLHCTQLIEKIPVCFIERPRDMKMLPDVARKIEEFVTDMPSCQNY